MARNVMNKLRGGVSRVTARVSRLGRFFARTQWLAGLYYAAFPDIFGREHKAVLAGKHLYERTRAEGTQRYLLRRNVHMLEKGLSMRPRRDVFALGYIGETVTLYRHLVGEAPDACSTDRELQWANDVLSEFFAIAGEDPVIERARRAFRGAPLGVDDRSPDGLKPYRRDLDREPAVDYDSLLELARRRRSVRWFDPRPVPRDVIEKALLVAGLSPSACNRQPYEFRVFDDPELVQKVAEIPMGTRGWSHNIPTFIVIVGKLSAFFSERDRHLIYTDGCLAAMAFVFAIESLGLSTCCVNWPDVAERERRMAELLDLDRDERPVMCLAVGYPDPEGLVPFSHKKPFDEIARYNAE
jgi:nitroreductase